MAHPLSPKVSTALNVMRMTPPTVLRQNLAENTTHEHNIIGNDIEDQPSSPFVPHVSGSPNLENPLPIKFSRSPSSYEERDSTIGVSSLKMLKSRTQVTSPTKPTKTERSPRKMSSPEKRFPVKVNTSPIKRSFVSEPALKDLLRVNEGLTKAIEIFKSDDSMVDDEELYYDMENTIVVGSGDAEPDGFADETAFSTFSAVPDMTMLAKIGCSPTKSSGSMQNLRLNDLATPSTMRRAAADGSPISKSSRNGATNFEEAGNTTNLIVDFTEQFNNFGGYSNISPAKMGSAVPKSSKMPDLFAYTQNARTPSPAKHRRDAHSPSSKMSNLLDFDIPPAPTPRSMPSITPRELESLKSDFLSEISSLKASLSGKEAEILSLKSAVGDAEKRVGSCMEQVREERGLKEQAGAESEGWQKRCQEMEQVLRNVREEIVHGEREQEALEGRLDESEKRREAAEIMAQEAESKIAGMRAGSSSLAEPDDEGKKGHVGGSSREVEVAVEKVARELHSLYKSKHETKVAALKKSYEGRWDKKVKELEKKVDELLKENEEIRIGRDATMSGVVPRISGTDYTEELKTQAANDAKTLKELEAKMQGLSEEMRSIKINNLDLRHELEQERVEKGELVAACDELLALQEVAIPTHPALTSGVENLRGSISRASGLRAPNFASAGSTTAQSNESRIGRVEKSRSGSAQGMRPGSGMGVRTGIMNSIEKMGGYRSKGE